MSSGQPRTLASVACLVAAATLIASAAAAPGPTLAIVGAEARAVAAVGHLHNATILVRDGHIIAVAAGLSPPPGSRVIDAAGRIVTPGLMSAGSQLGIVEIEGVDADDSAGSGSVGAAFDPADTLNTHSTSFAVARADGLTRAVTYPSLSAQPPIDGLAAVLRLDEDSDLVDRPRAGVFATISGLSQARAGGSRAAAWALLRQALERARACRAAPRDCPAAQGSGAAFDAANRAALARLFDARMVLAIVANRESDLRAALRLADEFRLHLVIYGGAEAWRLAPALAAHHIAVVLNPFANGPATFDEIGARADNAALLQRAGVVIAFAVPGIFATHNAGLIVREAAGVAVANGLAWDDALRALTLNPARIWGIDDHYGSLRAGAEADLVIWDGDPLEPASAPVTVLVRGREVALRTRQSELAERYAPARAHDPWPPAYR